MSQSTSKAVMNNLTKFQLGMYKKIDCVGQRLDYE